MDGRTQPIEVCNMNILSLFNAMHFEYFEMIWSTQHSEGSYFIKDVKCRGSSQQVVGGGTNRDC